MSAMDLFKSSNLVATIQALHHSGEPIYNLCNFVQFGLSTNAVKSMTLGYIFVNQQTLSILQSRNQLTFGRLDLLKSELHGFREYFSAFPANNPDNIKNN